MLEDDDYLEVTSNEVKGGKRIVGLRQKLQENALLAC